MVTYNNYYNESFVWCRCKAGENRCRNGGRCINRYASTGCDCFGTGYEGDSCDYDSKYLNLRLFQYFVKNHYSRRIRNLENFEKQDSLRSSLFSGVQYICLLQIFYALTNESFLKRSIPYTNNLKYVVSKCDLKFKGI